MTKTRNALRTATGLAALGLTAAAFSLPATAQQSPNLEIIHHPNYDKTLFMPFSPAIKIKSGGLSGSPEGPRSRSITTIRTSASRS